MELMKVVNGDLCSGCGACAGICPVNAINFDSKEPFIPILDKAKCTKCNLCYEVCPGKGWNPVRRAAEICEQQGIEMDLHYGPVVNYYLGKSVDQDISIAGASGGIGTSLLLYLLEKKIVNTVAVVILNKGRPEVRITDDPKVIKKASGSKYSPVPLMKDVITELKNNPGKIAITVIPCQMAALENAIRLNIGIDRKLIYAIGLFCGDLKEYRSVEQIAKSLNIKHSDESEFLGWRYGKWPGEATFKLKNGETRGKELQKWLGISIPFYSLHRCLMCPARENWLADLALADNHRGQTGETVIVARTKKGNKVLKAAEKDRFIYLKEIDVNRPDTFNVTLTKFVPALLYINYRANRKLPVPSYDYDTKYYMGNLKKARKLSLLMKYRLFILIRGKYVLKIVTSHPKLMEKLGYFLNRFPKKIPGYYFLVKIKRQVIDKFLFK